jgi:Tfp pilus assembly protein PilV
MHPSTSPRRQRGIGLLEALIAFLVLSLGMLAIARMQGQMRLSAEVARQRSEAVRLAQEDIESLRAFSVLAAASGARSFDAIASETRTVDAAAGYATNTTYLVTRQIDNAAALSAKQARVTVSWTDRHGGAQQAALASLIAGNAPAFGAVLGLSRSGAPTRGPFGRSVRIPSAAKDLGDGRSAFKPVGNGTVALLFDNGSGLLAGRCASVAATTPTSALTAASLGPCDANVGHLLSGVVRFSSVSPPDAAHAAEPPPALSVAMAMTGGTYAVAPACQTEAITSAGGDRFVAWHCAVYPLANGQWSGRATLVPSGWVIGTGAADKRVCRYSADLDGSGAIDTNLEHPSTWVGVDASLANQDFLVVNGSETCPAGHAVQVAGNNGDVYVDLGTAQHQP